MSQMSINRVQLGLVSIISSAIRQQVLMKEMDTLNVDLQNQDKGLSWDFAVILAEFSLDLVV